VIVREQIRLDGVSIAIARPARESGARLLFIHVLFAAGWLFERWMTDFAERGHAACAVDLRGHGASAPVSGLGRVSLRDYVDDALRATRALGSVVVVGHSMGALVAQKLAEVGAVKAAGVLSPAPPRGIPPALASSRRASGEVSAGTAALAGDSCAPADADAIIMNRIPPDERRRRRPASRAVPGPRHCR
jgi:pimeloyl-ACP methyl ester carboxylesterase